MIRILVGEFIQRLKNKGIAGKIINQVVEELFQGLCFEVKPNKSFTIDGGENFKIQITNQQGEKPTKEDLLSTSNFEIEMNGIDTNQIKSVIIPKLDCSVTEALSITLEVFPFKIPQFNFRKSTK